MRVLAKRSLGAVTLKYRVNGGAPCRPRRRASGPAASGTARRRRLLPRDPGRRHRNAAGRRREGVVRGGGRRGREVRLVHVHGEGRRAAAGCSCSRPRTTPASRRCTRRSGPAVPLVLPRRAGGERLRRRRLRRRRERAARRRARSASSHTTTRSSGTRATTSSRATSGWRPAPRRGSRTTSCSPYGSTSTRAASLLYTGKYAGLQYAQGYEYDLEHERCRATRTSTADGCQRARGRLPAVLPRSVRLQRRRRDDGERQALRRARRRRPVHRSLVGVRRERGRQPGPRRVVHRDERDPAHGARIPQFDSWASAKYVRPGGPFEPAHRTHYAYSQIADVIVQAPHADDRPDGQVERQPLVLDLATTPRPTGTSCSSRHTRSARTTGRRCRTRTGTPARAPGRTTRIWRAAPRAGEQLHPWLDHYQTHNADGTCTPTGTTGVWNAASGSSNGWEQWSIDLSAYAGKQVEISIAYASDWSIAGARRVRRRHHRLDRARRRRSRTASAAGRCRARLRAARRTRTTGSRRPLTASPRAPRSRRRTRSTSGFGFEGISTPATRNAVMGRAMDFLLD